MVDNINPRHGSAYDCGECDSYYQRPFNPHYYLDAPYEMMLNDIVELKDMSAEEIVQYTKGFNDNEKARNFKNWGRDTDRVICK